MKERVWISPDPLSLFDPLPAQKPPWSEIEIDRLAIVLGKQDKVREVH